MRRFTVLGLLLLPAACAQILGVGDFSDQEADGTTGIGGSGGATTTAGGSNGSTSTMGGTGGGTSSTGGQNSAGGTLAGSAGEGTGGRGTGGGTGGGGTGGGTGGGGTGGGIGVCEGEFECDGATLVSCASGVRTEVERCGSAALCDASAGECTVPACDAGERHCQGASLEGCNSNRTGFDVLDECATAALCDPDLDECVAPACDSGDFQCNDASLEACAEDRTGFVEAFDCTTAELCDDSNGQCDVAECTPNEYECNAGVLLRCSSGGTSLDFVASCATAALCNASQGRCETPACAVGEHECNGATLSVCDADRDGFEQSATCATAALCDANAGQCDSPACSVNQHQCQGNVLRVCNASRTGFTTQQSCGVDEICSASPAACQGLDELLGGLDGHLYEVPCGDAPSSDDCGAAGHRFNGGALTPCMGGANDGIIEYGIGGIAGDLYDVTLHFYGILGPKNYGNGVTRDAGSGRPDLNFGTPTPWGAAAGGHAYPASSYDTYELRVFNEDGQEIAAYYINTDTQEGHYTMGIDYEKTITVVGGGMVRFRANDPNCRIIKNCGPSGGYPCAAKARTVDVSAADPQPSNLVQPGLGVSSDHAGQWLLIDAVSVAVQ